MKKRITLLALTAMLLGAVGCGGSTEKKAAYPADGDAMYARFLKK